MFLKKKKEELSILFWYLKSKRLKGKLLTRKKLDAYQAKELKKYIKWIKKSSPYVKANYQSNHNISAFPIMNKEFFMNYFTEWNTKGINKSEALKVALKAEEERDFVAKVDGVTVGMSSGTSGKRGMFLVSDSEREKWTGVILSKLLPNGILHPEKIAFFLRANSNLYESTNQKRLQFKFFDLYKLTLDQKEIIQQLNLYKPTILIAPPSVLCLIANYLKDGTINIKPQKIISVAEVLEDVDKKYLEEVFNQTIHQVYQCTEGFLASTCEFGHLHLNEEHVYIEKEYIEGNRFIPIITDFSRTTQPIVRYRLNDILVEKVGTCPCSSPTTWIERIEGRCDDIFQFIALNGQKVTIYPDYFRKLFYYEEEVEEYVVTLNDQGIKISIKPYPSENTKDRIFNQLSELFQTANCEFPIIEWSVIEQHSYMSKRKRVRNERKIH